MVITFSSSMVYGADVLVEEPEALRHAIIAHLARALDAYDQAVFNKDSGPESERGSYRNDDVRPCARH